MNSNQKIALGVVIAIVATFFVLLLTNTPQPQLGAASGNRPETSFGYNEVTTSQVTMSAGNSTFVTGTSSKRAYVYLGTNCSNYIYIRQATTSGSDAYNLPTSGVLLSATNTPYEIKQENRYTGPIYASSSAACILNVIEAKF